MLCELFLSCFWKVIELKLLTALNKIAILIIKILMHNNVDWVTCYIGSCYGLYNISYCQELQVTHWASVRFVMLRIIIQITMY